MQSTEDEGRAGEGRGREGRTVGRVGGRKGLLSQPASTSTEPPRSSVRRKRIELTCYCSQHSHALKSPSELLVLLSRSLECSPGILSHLVMVILCQLACTTGCPNETLLLGVSMRVCLDETSI